MQSGPGLTRREAISRGALGAALLGLMGSIGCSGSRTAPTTRSSGSPAPSNAPSANPASTANLDAQLRSRAISEERQLLAACAAPTGMEPFATLRTMHLKHLQTLTGRPVTPPVAGPRAPAVAGLVIAERSATAARLHDCLHASPSLAPLLASLAAAGDVSVALLAP